MRAKLSIVAIMAVTVFSSICCRAKTVPEYAGEVSEVSCNKVKLKDIEGVLLFWVEDPRFTGELAVGYEFRQDLNRVRVHRFEFRGVDGSFNGPIAGCTVFIPLNQLTHGDLVFEMRVGESWKPVASYRPK